MVLSHGERLVSGEEKKFLFFCVASPSNIQNFLCICKKYCLGLKIVPELSFFGFSMFFRYFWIFSENLPKTWVKNWVATLGLKI